MSGAQAHPSAIIDPGATLGEGCRVWHFSHVCAGARLGRRCSLGQNVYIAPTAVLGDNCKVQNNVSIYDGVTLGDDVFVGPSAVFTNVVNPRSHTPRRSEYKPTTVRDGATLGANCTIVCGVTLGRHCFVAAGAVVTRDIDDHTLVAGVPARPLGYMCRCGERLTHPHPNTGHTACTTCGTRYRLHDGILRAI
jgi:UDP-2-acetamido-3-amino-2,3-dideoxy-glucuronate N-acetyltransferase